MGSTRRFFFWLPISSYLQILGFQWVAVETPFCLGDFFIEEVRTLNLIVEVPNGNLACLLLQPFTIIDDEA